MTCGPSTYIMDHPDVPCSCMENSIGLKRVYTTKIKAETEASPLFDLFYKTCIMNATNVNALSENAVCNIICINSSSF